MKKGFTLIELLVVTVVIVALMGIVFRLTGIASGASATETTVHRLQCLENCLSGYYAAFGSYPPVPLQGTTRNIYRMVSDDQHFIQSDDPGDSWSEGVSFDTGTEEGQRAYYSVEAACRSQPVRVSFPPPSEMSVTKNGQRSTVSSFDAYQSYQNAVKSALEASAFDSDKEERIKRWVNRSLEDISGRPGFLSKYQGTTSANELQLFRFGLLSFLLPRYRFMLNCARGSSSGHTEAFNNAIDQFRQWTENNTLPPRMDSGVSYASWKEFCNIIGSDDDWQIDVIPSQAACARWLPNLRDILSGPSGSFFGTSVATSGGNGIPDVRNAHNFSLYFPGGYSGSSNSRGYPLLSYTVADGWGKDFFYYSPPPYQSYTLWSAGANGRTFPPWVDLDQFRADHPKQFEWVMKWTADDIKHMSTGK